MDSDVTPLTDESYWTELWDGQQHKVRHLRWVYVTNRHLAKLFEKGLSGIRQPKLVELGCADSLWLPYLGKNYESDCYGVDFSELGCQLAQRNLALADVSAKIFCEDIFTFIKSNTSDYDFVFSMGLLEHFTEPSRVLDDIGKLLKPGGKMLTILPNLRGMYTPIARVASPKLLATHQVITPSALKDLHQSVGLDVTEFGFTGGPFKLSVVDYSPWRSVIGRFGHDVLCKCVNLTDIIVGNILSAVRIPNQQLSSPYVYVLCIKPN
ncbi:methyltransferase domain-containing protein [Candidatus Poribacteria bacterium]|nr:methyltransferase domain-containing protein [Candidatus Poribacteria bacterium]